MVVISYLILPGTFWYIGIWRSYNIVCLFFFVYILCEMKCKYMMTYIKTYVDSVIYMCKFRGSGVRSS